MELLDFGARTTPESLPLVPFAAALPVPLAVLEGAVLSGASKKFSAPIEPVALPLLLRSLGPFELSSRGFIPLNLLAFFLAAFLDLVED